MALGLYSLFVLGRTCQVEAAMYYHTREVIVSSKSSINQLFKEDTADVLPKIIKIDVLSLPMRNRYTGGRRPR